MKIFARPLYPSNESEGIADREVEFVIRRRFFTSFTRVSAARPQYQSPNLL
jgi:hypothetical protein